MSENGSGRRWGSHILKTQCMFSINHKLLFYKNTRLKMTGATLGPHQQVYVCRGQEESHLVKMQRGVSGARSATNETPTSHPFSASSNGGWEEPKSERPWRTPVRQCHLGVTRPVHSSTHGGCGCLHRIKVNISTQSMYTHTLTHRFTHT